MKIYKKKLLKSCISKITLKLYKEKEKESLPKLTMINKENQNLAKR
jgi:hypothetical protein